MDNLSLLKMNLHLQHLPAYPSDLPYIDRLLQAMSVARTSLYSFSYLNTIVPITIVDKGYMR